MLIASQTRYTMLGCALAISCFVGVHVLCARAVAIDPGDRVAPPIQLPPVHDSSGRFLVTHKSGFGADTYVILRDWVKPRSLSPSPGEAVHNDTIAADEAIARIGVDQESSSDYYYGIVGTIGWPIRWGHVCLESKGSQVIQLRRTAGLAVGPVWIPAVHSWRGLFVSVICYVILFSASLLIARRAVILKRLSRGLCSHCAYPLQALRCPECGLVAGRRRR